MTASMTSGVDVPIRRSVASASLRCRLHFSRAIAIIKPFIKRKIRIIRAEYFLRVNYSKKNDPNWTNQIVSSKPYSHFGPGLHGSYIIEPHFQATALWCWCNIWPPFLRFPRSPAAERDRPEAARSQTAAQTRIPCRKMGCFRRKKTVHIVV